MPLLIGLSRMLRGNPKSITTVLGVVSALSVAGVAAIAFAHTGAVVFAPLLFWLALPERLALANRIWPEPLLTAFATAVAGLLLVQPENTAVWLGLSCALATLTRVDALAWAPLAAVALASTQAIATQAWLQILMPTAVVLLGLSLINGLRYGIPLPDTTAFFNLLVMSKEGDNEQSIQQLVRAALKEWESQSSFRGRLRLTGLHLRTTIRSPGRFLVAILRRASSLLGLETFTTENTLGRERLAAMRPWNRWLLRYGASVLLGSALASALWQLPQGLWFTLPSAGFLLTSSLAHTRTRFRQPLMPVAVLILTEGWSRTAAGSGQWQLLSVCALGSTLAILSSLVSARRENTVEP